jgi:hypothetical protein
MPSAVAQTPSPDIASESPKWTLIAIASGAGSKTITDQLRIRHGSLRKMVVVGAVPARYSDPKGAGNARKSARSADG